jgi:glucosamine kinase
MSRAPAGAESLMTLPPSLLAPERPSTATHVLGLDGGATKTTAALLDPTTYQVSFGHAGPSNADAVGEERAHAEIHSAIEATLAESGVPAERVGAVVAVAGTITQTLGPQLEERFDFDFLHLINDVVAAWAVGTRAAPGVATIAGTGSHVFGVGPEGRPWRTGGWGHILGDEGSAYWLGLGGLKAALSYRDGSGPPTRLLADALEAYSLVAIEDLPALFYGKPLTKAEVARFATEVAEAATEGDEVALDLFDRAGRDLANQVHAVVSNTGLGPEPFVVALIGSVFKAGRLIRDSFESSVREFAPKARFEVPELPPVAGSLLLALKSVGAWDSFDYDRLRDALSRQGETTPGHG